MIIHGAQSLIIMINCHCHHCHHRHHYYQLSSSPSSGRSHRHIHCYRRNVETAESQRWNENHINSDHFDIFIKTYDGNNSFDNESGNNEGDNNHFICENGFEDCKNADDLKLRGDQHPFLPFIHPPPASLSGSGQLSWLSITCHYYQDYPQQIIVMIIIIIIHRLMIIFADWGPIYLHPRLPGRGGWQWWGSTPW